VQLSRVKDRHSRIRSGVVLGMETPTDVALGPDEGPDREYWGNHAWRIVLRAVKERGRHPAPEYLGALIRDYGVPDFARSYVGGRVSGEIVPRGRPVPLPPRSSDGSLFFLDELLKEAFGGLDAHRYKILSYARNRAEAYSAFQTLREPRKENLHRLRFLPSRKAWIVKEPVREARRQVAKRWHFSAATIEDWDRNDRAAARRARQGNSRAL